MGLLQASTGFESYILFTLCRNLRTQLVILKKTIYILREYCGKLKKNERKEISGKTIK
jgi:hypothetical protein